MALSMQTALGRIRDRIALVSGIEAVYSEGDSDHTQIPDALTELPCVLVLSGPITEYILRYGQHRITYEVRVLVLAEPGGRIGQAMAELIPIVNAIVEEFVGNVTLGGNVTYCVFQRSSGIDLRDWGEVEYYAHEIILEVSEAASATPAGGSP